MIDFASQECRDSVCTQEDAAALSLVQSAMKIKVSPAKANTELSSKSEQTSPGRIVCMDKATDFTWPACKEKYVADTLQCTDETEACPWYKPCWDKNKKNCEDRRDHEGDGDRMGPSKIWRGSLDRCKAWDFGRFGGKEYDGQTVKECSSNCATQLGMSKERDEPWCFVKARVFPANVFSKENTDEGWCFCQRKCVIDSWSDIPPKKKCPAGLRKDDNLATSGCCVASVNCQAIKAWNEDGAEQCDKTPGCAAKEVEATGGWVGKECWDKNRPGPFN